MRKKSKSLQIIDIDCIREALPSTETKRQRSSTTLQGESCVTLMLKRQEKKNHRPTLGQCETKTNKGKDTGTKVF